MTLVNECYCICGGRFQPAPERRKPGVDYGRLLILCPCCDKDECPYDHGDDEPVWAENRIGTQE